MEVGADYASASAIQRQQVANRIGFAIVRKSLDTQRQQGQAAVELIDQAAQLQDQLASGRIDVRL